jgi:hypothetical protein
MTPITNYRADTTDKPEGFKKGSFTYIAERDCYRCPRGCILRYAHTTNRLRIYLAGASECGSCADKDKCLEDGGKVRSVSRHPEEESRERNIQRCNTDEGRAALRSRKGIVEGPFGHMKTHGGLTLISSRGKEKAEMKVVMAAVAYNLMKLAKARARALRLSPTSCWIFRPIHVLLRPIWGLLTVQHRRSVQYRPVQCRILQSMA